MSDGDDGMMDGRENCIGVCWCLRGSAAPILPGCKLVLITTTACIDVTV